MAPSDKQADPRWPAVLNTLATLALFYVVPGRLKPGPPWLAPAVGLLLLMAAVVAHRTSKHAWNHRIALMLQVGLTGIEIWSLAFLILTLPQKHRGAGDLLQAATALWIANILIFASWYWRLDAGGPYRRATRESHMEGAFLFPALTLPPGHSGHNAHWKPGFIDYLFLAFNTSTAFSPTDTAVLSGWAKAVMMLQATISLGVIAVLLARGISLL